MPRTCTIAGCERKHAARGLCGTHYARWRNHGDPGGPEAMRPRRYDESATCERPGCDERPTSKGLCTLHYTRSLRGQEMGSRRRRPPRGISEIGYLHYHSQPTEAGCLEWQGARKENGYGVWTLSTRGKGHRLAHRVAYELAHGVTLDPHTPIHHTCANRACVNPEHLQAVAPHENIAEMLERRHYQQRIRDLEAQLAAQGKATP